MEINEWLAKARLLEMGDALYISCVSSGEAFKTCGKFEGQIRKGGYESYSLIAYVKPDEGERKWWVCIAKVKRTDQGYIKKASGEMVVEGDSWVTIGAQRIFRLAINDGKSYDEVIGLAINDLERRYVQELWETTVGNVIKYKELEGK